jgi:hypothetical protein
MTEFTPRYLTPEGAAELYRQALAQAEAQVANAWINHRLAPHDGVRRAAYAQALEQLAALETDLRRLFPQLGEGVAAGGTALPEDGEVGTGSAGEATGAGGSSPHAKEEE